MQHPGVVILRPDTPTWRRCSSGALTLKLAFSLFCEDLPHPIDAICVVYWMSIGILILLTYYISSQSLVGYQRV